MNASELTDVGEYGNIIIYTEKCFLNLFECTPHLASSNKSIENEEMSHTSNSNTTHEVKQKITIH